MLALIFYVVITLLVSFSITYYLVPFLSTIAHRLNFLDEPDGKIKTQVKPIPYLGGLAVYGGFVASLGILRIIDSTFLFNTQFILFLFGITLLMMLGLIDDLIILSPHQKFFGQIIATLCFLWAGFYLKEQFFYTLWHIPLSFLWILSIINAFNLVDVMDGLTSIISMGAIFSFGAMALYFNNNNALLLLSSLLGSLGAFFWYNKPPARIYLGDAGSLFIGGFFATVPFLFPWGTYTWDGYLAPLVILAVPLLELGALILIRTYKGIPFYKGSPDHFSLYMQRNGWSKNGILGYIALLNGIQLIVSLLFVAHCITTTLLFAIGLIYAIIWMAILSVKKNTLLNSYF